MEEEWPVGRYVESAKRAEETDRDMWLERPKHYYQRLEKRFRGTKILDVGCGRSKFRGAVGLDVRTNSAADICTDLDQLPWPLRESSFDLVVMRHVLEHMRDVVCTVEELYRIAKPGGRVVVETPHFSWVEAFRHPGHLHFFAGGSFDYYYPGNPSYRAHLRVCRRRIYFNDLFKVIGFEAVANRFSQLYERHLAFIFPAGSVVWELEAVKGPGE